MSDGGEQWCCGEDKVTTGQVWEGLEGGQAGSLLTGRKACLAVAYVISEVFPWYTYLGNGFFVFCFF